MSKTTQQVFRGAVLALMLVLAACKWTKEDVAETSDPAVLQRIYREAEEAEVKAAALAKIDDPAFLLRVAAGTAPGATEADGLAVLSRLPAEHVRGFLEGYPRPTPTQIEALLAAIEDQDLLVDIALILKPNYGDQVLEQLTEQAALIRFFEEYDAYELQGTAFDRITDQTYLADFVISQKNGSLWPGNAGHVLSTVTDQRQMARIVFEAGNSIHASGAIRELKDQMASKLTDQDVLARLVINGGINWKEAAARITDQDVLERIVREARYPDFSAVVLDRIENPELLLEVAATDRTNAHIAETAFFSLNHPDQKALIEKWQPWFNPAATGAQTDPLLLAKITLKAYRYDVRAAAVKNPKTPDAAILELARTEATGVVNNAIWARIRPEDAQDVLAYVAVNASDPDQRLRAAEKLTDQAALRRVFSGEELVEERSMSDGRRANSAVRLHVLSKIDDQAILTDVLTDTQNDPEFRLTAAARVHDQALLKRLAMHTLTIERQIGVTGVTDGPFLMEMFADEPSAVVRATIIDRFNAAGLRQIALTAFHQADREYAVVRLKKTEGTIPADVEEASRLLDAKTDKLLQGGDASRLVAHALTAKFDVTRVAAAEGLADMASLEEIAKRGSYRKVLGIVLEKMSDPDALARIAKSASDPAMRIAAQRKSGAMTWDEIFVQASAQNASVAELGDALAAVTLFSEIQGDARKGVQEAALNLIRNGDEARIPEMSELLEDYGDTRLAEDYLNSGQPDLDRVARDWAHARGYNVGSGRGSARARWGSRN